MAHVAELLRSLPGLRQLSVADCDIGDACSDMFAAVLPSHTGLQRLDLSGNQMTTAGGRWGTLFSCIR